LVNNRTDFVVFEECRTCTFT